MIRDLSGVDADADEAAMLADLAQLTPEPAGLGTLLRSLGYQPRSIASGLYAAAGPDDAGMPALLFPLYTNAGLAVRKRRLVGRHVSRTATLAAGLCALRSVDRRPPLIFMREPTALPAGISPSQVVSLEGGVVPRLWRNCFGSFDALARIMGQRSHPGLSNTAVNAIEAAVPVLQALMQLRSDIQLRSRQRGHVADAPLQPRLTISAAHGGSQGSVLPAVFDILLNRRYDPAENVDAALDEIKAAIVGAAARTVRLEVAITNDKPPVPDPDAMSRSREERALAAGWGWPQVPFSNTSTLVPGATVLGGLQQLDAEPGTEEASTTLDDMAALARTLRALLTDVDDRPHELRFRPDPPTASR